MILAPMNPIMHPDIKAIVKKTADKTTGDGVFEDTDLVRIPYDGFLIVNAVVTATGDSLLYVPQIHHQENRYNNIPVLGAGITPDTMGILNYKIPVHKGDTPRILYDEVNDTDACFMGCFYRGMNLKRINNPIAYNTPDVLVVKRSTATHQNILEDTDLEDFPLPGWLLIWAWADTDANTIQVMQKGHQTGNTSAIPEAVAGVTRCGYEAPYKMYVPATGNPTVTITNAVPATNIVMVVAGFYVDWENVSTRMRARMGY